MVKRVVKKYLVPHEGNQYKPHFFRAKAFLVLSVLAIAIFSLAVGYGSLLPRIDYLAAVLPGVLVDLVNEDRQIYTLAPLTPNPLLEAAAREKAQDMARQSYFAHVSPTGITPWYWITRSGYRFIYAGENLAINFSESADVNRAWMESPTHRANILNGNFSEIGIATAEGIYQGRPTIFVVQMFGRPVPAVNVPTPPVASILPATPVAIAAEPEPVVIPDVTPITETETFIAVRNDTLAEEVAPTEKVDLPETQETLGSTRYATLSEKVLTSPRTVMRVAYGALLALILLAIVMSLGVELKRHHGKHLVSGVLVVLLVVALSYAYEHIAIASLLVR